MIFSYVVNKAGRSGARVESVASLTVRGAIEASDEVNESGSWVGCTGKREWIALFLLCLLCRKVFVIVFVILMWIVKMDSVFPGPSLCSKGKPVFLSSCRTKIVC